MQFRLKFLSNQRKIQNLGFRSDACFAAYQKALNCRSFHLTKPLNSPVLFIWNTYRAGSINPKICTKIHFFELGGRRIQREMFVSLCMSNLYGMVDGDRCGWNGNCQISRATYFKFHFLNSKAVSEVSLVQVINNFGNCILLRTPSFEECK